jgi:RNase P subunit RPR2
MKLAADVKSSNGTKAPSKVEGGDLKRLPIKKVYCTKCKKLVKGQVQISGDTKRIICPICSLHLRVWKSTAWTSIKSEVFTPA